MIQEEKMRILRLLEDGKITAAQADELIAAIDSGGNPYGNDGSGKEGGGISVGEKRAVIERREREERLKLQEEETRIREEDARIREEDARIRDEEARIREEEARIRDEEARIREEEKRIREEEARFNGALTRIRYVKS